jgi:hypothetical protein
MIKRLFSKIPRDRTLLLLLAPVVAIVAIGGAAMLDKGPTPATVRAGTTTTTVKGDSKPGTEVAGETTVPSGDAGAGGSTSDGGSSEEVSMGQPDLSAEANSDYRGGVPPGADVLDSNLTAPTAAPPTTVAPATTVPATTVPATTVPGQTTTTTPTTTTSTTTSTIPGPPPVVSESPVAALLPLSALLAVGIAVGLLFRRRRRQGPATK